MPPYLAVLHTSLKSEEVPKLVARRDQPRFSKGRCLLCFWQCRHELKLHGWLRRWHGHELFQWGKNHCWKLQLQLWRRTWNWHAPSENLSSRTQSQKQGLTFRRLSGQYNHRRLWFQWRRVHQPRFKAKETRAQVARPSFLIRLRNSQTNKNR